MMERFVFLETDYVPDLDMLRDGKFYHGDVDSPAVARLLERCRAAVRPRAVAACVEVSHDSEGHVTAGGGEEMSSPVLDGQLGKLHRAFAYVATCGPEIAGRRMNARIPPRCTPTTPGARRWRRGWSTATSVRNGTAGWRARSATCSCTPTTCAT